MRRLLCAATMLCAAVAVGQAHAADRGIAVIVKTANSNYWQNVRKGAADAVAKVENYTMTFQGPTSESAVADQVNMVADAVTQKVAAIVLAPSDPDALVPSIRKAWEAHIPVVLIDSMISDSGAKYYQSFLATDNEAAGEALGKEMVDHVGQTGKVAIMSYVPGVGSEIGRVGGFRKYIAEHSHIQIVGPFYSQSQMALAMNQTTDVLASNPDLKGIFAANEMTAVGVGRAIQQAGKSGKLYAIAFDGNEDEQGFVRSGTFQLLAVQGSYAMGAKGVETAIGVLTGAKPTKYVNTGVVFVTSANLDSPEAKQVLY
ncbi:ABC transporter substrate-binding protein [Gluconacetobacter diazotrophicus]|nr:ABC transporter substrate-binding protein [Gluconacetobacter diazotrophicus]